VEAFIYIQLKTGLLFLNISNVATVEKKFIKAISQQNNLTFSIPHEEIETHTEETARRAQKEKDKFFSNLREEINNLKWHAHTVEDAQLMEHLSFIFTQIADYIENH
jgi:hypothetical protein